MRTPTGPIPRDEFEKLIDAPHGAARAAIRSYDPLWGREGGEKFRWRVTFEREITECGSAVVEAASKEEAEEIAGNLGEDKIDWDLGVHASPRDGDVVGAEPLGK